MNTPKSMTASVRLRPPVLRSTRPELAQDFYHGVLGTYGPGALTIDGPSLAYNRGMHSSFVVFETGVTTSQWFPVIEVDDLAALKAKAEELGGSCVENPIKGGDLLVTAPDGSQIIAIDSRRHDDLPDRDAVLADAADPTGPPVMLELCTGIIDESAAFYCELLGVEQQAIPNDPYGYRVLASGSEALIGMVDMTSFFAEATSAYWIPYFHVSDISTIVETSVSYGGRVKAPLESSKFGASYAVLVDPTGAAYGIRELPDSGIFGSFDVELGDFADSESADGVITA